jgi:hypothetical protein
MMFLPCAELTIRRRDMDGYTKKDADRYVIFLGGEGVLWSVSSQEHDENGWDIDAVKNLRYLCYHNKIDIVVLSEGDYPDSIDSVKLLFKPYYLDGNILEVLGVSHSSTKEKVIQEYLMSHPDLLRYAIVDYADLEKYFRGRTVCISKGHVLNKEAATKAKRILEFGPWWTDQYRVKVDKVGKDQLIEDYYKKVIFLDIDGVLNEDNRGPTIVEDYVKNLAWIVEETGAEIILSSSWRYTYGSYAYMGFPGDDQSMETLLDNFDKYALKVSGITPRYFNGPDGRPFEIRSWLCQRPEVERFVILDDETFWKWKWLEPHVVCTSRKTDRMECQTGLNREYAERAIIILKG